MKQTRIEQTRHLLHARDRRRAGENTRWVLVGVVGTLEGHLSGICERQQREKNVRPLTFMDNTFTGYTVYGFSPDTFVRIDRQSARQNCHPLSLSLSLSFCLPQQRFRPFEGVGNRSGYPWGFLWPNSCVRLVGNIFRRRLYASNERQLLLRRAINDANDPIRFCIALFLEIPKFRTLRALSKIFASFFFSFCTGACPLNLRQSS